MQYESICLFLLKLRKYCGKVESQHFLFYPQNFPRTLPLKAINVKIVLLRRILSGLGSDVINGRLSMLFQDTIACIPFSYENQIKP